MIKEDFIDILFWVGYGVAFVALIAIGLFLLWEIFFKLLNYKTFRKMSINIFLWATVKQYNDKEYKIFIDKIETARKNIKKQNKEKGRLE